jgi:non-ribosomal peptide synthetase component F
VVGRHEALHSRYLRIGPDAFARQVMPGAPEVTYQDLASHPAEDRMRSALRIFEEECAASFDPDSRWLHGFRLLALGPRDHVFIARFHHLNFDGASLVTFYRELSVAYDAFARGREPDLPPPPAQQSEILAALEARKSTRHHAADCAFWRGQLAGIPLVRLPFAPRASAALGDVGRKEPLEFDATLTARLEEIARQQSVTLYALFLAGLKVVLHRVTGQNDIPVGIAADRRDHAGLESVMGNFSNMLIVRSEVREATSFLSILRQVWTRTRTALDHRHLSSYELAENGSLPADPLSNPLRMVRFIKSPDDTNALRLSGLRLTAIPREHFHPGAILSIQMKHTNGRVVLEASHVPGVLPTDVVRSMFALYHDIMRIVAEAGDPMMDALPRWNEAVSFSTSDTPGHPTSPFEKTILTLYRQILKQPEAGPLDSFFELGGHSLLATLLLHRIEQSLGIAITYHALFENPTPRGLAGTLRVSRAIDLGPSRATLVRRHSGGPQPVNLYTRNEIRFLLSRRPRNITRSYRLRGPLQIGLLERALQWVVDRHDALRMRLSRVTGEDFIRSVEPVTVRLSVEAIKAASPGEQEAEVERFLEAEALRMFTVESFPFHVFTLLRIADDEHILVLNFHHIFFDGKSLSVFLRDLSAAYAALGRGREPDLPDLTFHFNDVMGWIEEWLTQGGLQSLHEYWKAQLRDLSLLRMPADLCPQQDGGVDGTIQHRHLGAELTRQARETATRLGTTFFGLNHTVVNALLHACGNEHEAHAAIMSCLRRHPDAEGVMGNFANPVPVRTNVAGNPTFRELVARTRRAAQNALGHRGLPFPQLRSLAPPTSTCGGNPFRVYLTEETSLEGQFRLADIEIEAIPRRRFTPSPMLVFQIASLSSDTIVRCLARPEYFSPQRTTAILDQYVRFLHCVVASPDRRLRDFPALGT